jgi:hypothetical protein
MNKLLNNYIVQVASPDVSGAEHLEMLQTRDKLAEIKGILTDEEQSILFNADRQLIKNVVVVNEELSQFIDLKNYRASQGILPQNWWWYLDVLSYLSISLGSIESLPGWLPVTS